MRVPESLAGLLDQGIIEDVVRPLMSGKEAHVYLVTVGGQPCVAKIYKDSQHRSFKQRAEYTEGRRVRSSRDQRAMEKRSRYGRKQDEAAWKSAEVDIIYRLRHAGVRVPAPYNFVDGVLLMELVCDEDGLPAPRLAEVDFDRDEARALFDKLLREVVKMLCAGVVHGDLSEYNVLLDEHGPVIIDFPQSVDAASNQNAKKLLLRDVDNLTRFLARLDHRARPMPYGHEIWAAYENNRLTPDMALTGKRQRDSVSTDTSSLLDEIEAAERDEAQRRRTLGLPPRRREVTIQPVASQSGRSDGRRPPRHDDRGTSERRAGPLSGDRSASARQQGPGGRQQGPGRQPAQGRQPARQSDARQETRQDAPARRQDPRPESAQHQAPASQNRQDAPARRPETRPGSAGQHSPGGQSREDAPARRPEAWQAQEAQAQDGGPARKRRRRRKKVGDGMAPSSTSHELDRSREASGGSREAEVSGSPAARSPHDHSRPREAGGSPSQSGAARPSDGTDEASGAPKKRRRRRRRRAGEVAQPPTGTPAGG